jgi:anti-sigma regulatory factor (Ser/Thr protein kinase)
MKKSGAKVRKGVRPDSETLVKLEMESNPECLCLVRATIERASEVLHFHETQTRAIVRSVDEALANVMRHAYKGAPGKPIEVICRRMRSKENGREALGIEILLHDRGKKADPKKLKGRPLDEIRPGGLGLHFIRESMDVVEFSRKNGKNQLRLLKYLHHPAEHHARPEGE